MLTWNISDGLQKFWCLLELGWWYIIILICSVCLLISSQVPHCELLHEWVHSICTIISYLLLSQYWRLQYDFVTVIVARMSEPYYLLWILYKRCYFSECTVIFARLSNLTQGAISQTCSVFLCSGGTWCLPWTSRSNWACHSRREPEGYLRREWLKSHPYHSLSPPVSTATCKWLKPALSA